MIMIHSRLKRTKLYLILFLFPIFTFSQNQIEIPVEYIKNDKNNIFNVSMLRQYSQLIPANKFENLTTNILKQYKGVKQKDSIAIYFKTENQRQFVYELYKKKQILKKDFLNYIHENNVDTIRLAQNKNYKDQTCVVLLELKKGKLYLTADVDRDKNFSNNVKQAFDLNLEQTKLIKEAQAQEYCFEIDFGNKLQYFKRDIIFYPESTNFQNIDEIQIKNSFVDYWVGKLIIDNQALNINYQGLNNNIGSFFYQPESLSFENKDVWFKKQFEKQQRDTLVFNRNTIKIDSISSDMKNIYITKIRKLEKNYGNYTGAFIKDFDLVDFENKKTKLHEVLKEKKYTLLDFWASWCGPCIEKFPEIKKLQNLHSDKLTVIGLSTENDFQKAKKAVEKYNLSWRNFQGKAISNQLDIHSIPSLFLIDENGKILSRDDFEEIKRILEN